MLVPIDPKEHQDACEVTFQSVLIALSAKQEDHQKADPKGRYLQLLASAASIPEDGERIAPTDKTWTDLKILPADLPFQTRVTQYNGPDGVGWEISAEYVLNGARCRRIQNVGPETHRDRDWEVVVAEAS